MKTIEFRRKKPRENDGKRLLGHMEANGEKLAAKRVFNNPMGKHAMKVVKDNKTVVHLPGKFSQIAWYFLARSGQISVDAIGRRRHCKKLCRGMEIPCQLEFNCSNKVQMKRLKELLARKIRV